MVSTDALDMPHNPANYTITPPSHVIDALMNEGAKIIWTSCRSDRVEAKVVINNSVYATLNSEETIGKATLAHSGNALATPLLSHYS
ncbi:hypothetical protein F7U66_00470 [Vibrio parahaemolyticus]|nr:hypothetical protein [Vibrio parahaemolyticus]